MSRPLSDHGTAQQAIDWAIDHNPDGGLEAEAFLRCWREGRLDEWPEFYAWLALEEARSPVISRQSSEEQYPQSETQSSAGNDARDTINTTSQIQHVPRREELIRRLHAYDGYEGGHSDAAQANAYELIAEAAEFLSTACAGHAVATLPQPGGWRPIETAPTNETVLVAGGDAEYPVTASWTGLLDEPWCIDGQSDVHGEIGWPTLWQPLPPVPTDGGKQDGSASSNSATRLASQGCDTGAPQSAGGRG